MGSLLLRAGDIPCCSIVSIIAAIGRAAWARTGAYHHFRLKSEGCSGRRERLHVPLLQPNVHVLLEPDGLSGRELDDRRSGLEFASEYASLANNGLQRSDPEFRVIRYWHCDCRVRKFFLHDDAAAPLPHFYEPMPRQDGTDFLRGKDTQSYPTATSTRVT